MKFYLLRAKRATQAYLVIMEVTKAGVNITALHPWGYWVSEGWIYSAITFGWTGPASDCTEWVHEELSEEEFNEALTKQGKERV